MKHSTIRRTIAISITALAATAAIAATALADGDHGTTMPGGTMPTAPAGHMAGPRMSVTLVATRDAKMGYNLQVKTNQFRWTPWNANKAHVQNQGHAHLYIDGTKKTRLYSPWYFLGDLTKGTHTIKVTLNGNDHGDYMRDGKVIEATRTITVA